MNKSVLFGNRTISPNQRFAARLDEVCASLREIRSNFNSVSDPAAIDALIYRENAVMCEFCALLHEAKSKKISLEIYERENNFRGF